jgi:D-3-phosphoglycerate dehydrogenase
MGKTLGVIGLGAIGGMVANAADALGMNVIGCDTYLTPAAAWHLSPTIKQAASFDEIFKTCDYISIHVPATPQTKNMICEKTIAMMKDGVRIINLARADLVCADDIKKALLDKKVARYITDFPTEDTVGAAGIVNIPHLGASTFESEDNCAVMAAKQLVEFLTNGNIKNSVNFPNVSIPHSANARVCVMYKNAPDMLSKITAAFADANVSVENLANATKGDAAYTIAETDKVGDDVVNALMAIDGVIRVNCY